MLLLHQNSGMSVGGRGAQVSGHRRHREGAGDRQFGTCWQRPAPCFRCFGECHQGHSRGPPTPKPLSYRKPSRASLLMMRWETPPIVRRNGYLRILPLCVRAARRPGLPAGSCRRGFVKHWACFPAGLPLRPLDGASPTLSPSGPSQRRHRPP